MKTKMTLAAAGLLCASAQAQAAPTTFVHLFEWTWQDIATECEQFLGPKGFAAVQVSPPNEHIQGSQWWTRYQPVSYALESRGGNRAQFIDMVQRCNAVGVEIYVDAIINHMANGSGTGTAGSSYGNRQYPIYGPQDFHDSCPINNEDYGQNRWRVQNCELVGLPDLKTENAYVQSKLADYMNDLVSIGVTGFRLDASKHMPAYDIGQILTQVNGNPLIFQEVIDQGGEAVTAAEYTGNGLVTEFKYTTMLGDTFKTGKLAWLSNFGEAWGMMPSYQAVVFVDNHDNQRGHGGAGNVVTYQDGKLYDLANVFMLAYPYGYPKVMSSYDYHHDTDTGGPGYSVHDNGNLNCFGSGWQCEHRWSMIHGAVDFRNNVNSNWQVTNWWDNGNNQIAFSRGDAGFVAINREGYGMSQTLQTGLSEGTYCDVLTGQKSEAGNSCSGRSVVVAGDGTANVSLDQMDALAVHQASKLSTVITIPGDVQRTVVFIKAETQSGQDMFIRGGIDHGFAATQGVTCTEQNKQCAISIEHNNLINATTAPWKNNDQYLDWYGVEAGQSSSAEGTALDWTVDVWPSTWGQKRTVAIDGYGEEPLNQYGPHYWMLDVQMDCSQTHNGWFEIKAFVKNGQGWESDIQQANAPYASNNHFAQCGKINVFEFGQNGSQHLDF